MKNNTYLFNVTIKAADGSCHTFMTIGKSLRDIYYNFDDKLYNGQPIEIIQVERKDKIIEGYISDLELNPDYKPTEENSDDATEPHKVNPSDR